MAYYAELTDKELKELGLTDDYVRRYNLMSVNERIIELCDGLTKEDLNN